MKRKQQRGTSKIQLIILAVVVLAVFGYIALRNKVAPSPMMYQAQQGTIQNDDGLRGTSDALDSTDVDSVDTQLDQNDADAASL